MATSDLILASTSAFKRRQLETLNLPFRSINPEVREEHPAGSCLKQLSINLSQEKAAAIASQSPASWVIGSDQTAEDHTGTLLTKPITPERAFNQLQGCQGQRIMFYSGACLINREANYEKAWTVATEVKFRNLTDSEIYRYIDADNPLHCAGSFKVEALGISLFETVKSDDPTALVGLPLITLCRELRAAGFLIP